MKLISKTKRVLITEKVNETFLHKFKGYGVYPSECKIKIFSRNNLIYILFIDINKGTSVTNVAEQLIEESWDLYLKGKYEKKDIRFLETYERIGTDELEIDAIIPVFLDDEVTRVYWVRWEGTL